VVGIELLAAAQGIDFRRPLTSSPELEQTYAIVREAAEPYSADRYFAPDIARATDGVRAGRYRAFAADLLPSTRGSTAARLSQRRNAGDRRRSGLTTGCWPGSNRSRPWAGSPTAANPCPDLRRHR